MSHQIRFYLSESMILAVQNEASLMGVMLQEYFPKEVEGVQFSRSSGTDFKQGRLWTQASNLSSFTSLCKAVKASAYYDRESGLWVKRDLRAEFESYRVGADTRLAALVARNRKHALEVLGGCITDHKDVKQSDRTYDSSGTGLPSDQP